MMITFELKEFSPKVSRLYNLESIMQPKADLSFKFGMPVRKRKFLENLDHGLNQLKRTLVYIKTGNLDPANNTL
jgi:hypothetical protein